jgi:hypothetical protein
LIVIRFAHSNVSIDLTVRLFGFRLAQKKST